MQYPYEYMKNMTDLPALLRENIRSLVPYSSARDEYNGEDAVFLDANENPYNGPLNRYPDPRQMKLKKRIAAIKGVPEQNIFLGNGSDEAIDLLIRAFCEPGCDNILAMKPTYGMYKVCADINQVEYREALLNDIFQVNVEQMLSLADENSKLLFLCSPNNPTSNSLDPENILKLIAGFRGIVVLDEAYIDFSIQPSFAGVLELYPNLVILQTFSKAWGMAGIRLGMAFASRDIIDVMNRIKYPYNVSLLTQQTALKGLESTLGKDIWVKSILEQRKILQHELSHIYLVKSILPSDANFLMVRFENPGAVFDYLIGKKIIVRDRSKVPLCHGYLRITIGTPEENSLLLSALNDFAGMSDNQTRNILRP
jgi:histidinol-phosphate aminotransferase